MSTMLTVPTTDFVWLDTCLRDSENQQSYLFEYPKEILNLTTYADVEGFLSRIDALADDYYLAGYLSYELGHYLFTGEVLEFNKGEGLAWLGVYDKPVVADKIKFVNQGLSVDDFSITSGKLSMDWSAYEAAIKKIHKEISRGNTYQVNLTLKYFSEFTGDPFALYYALSKRQSVRYGGMVKHDGLSVLSFSPELFFRREGRGIRCEPMKGTAARGRFGLEDEHIIATMQSDEKTLAENAMIVDLLRNDMGKICEWGSVTADNTFEVQTYPTLHQMTSRVSGRLKKNLKWSELLRALFPCGSITGAPKRSTMGIIQTLETNPRGVYTGMLGYIHRDEAVFNVPIRTISISDKGKMEMGLGSGIVYDSDARAEYEECLLKGDFLNKTHREFSLIETMLWQEGLGTVRNLDLHLQRLKRSADYFGIGFSREAALALLEQQMVKLDSPARLRLTLDEAGEFSLSASEVNIADFPEVVKVGLAKIPVSSQDSWLFHKTTNRAFYNETLKSAQAAGLFDVIFFNEQGDVTEGCICNVFTKCDQQWLTAPMESGLLPGVMRESVLAARSEIKIGRISRQNLLNSPEIFITNALRGVVKAELLDIEI